MSYAVNRWITKQFVPACFGFQAEILAIAECAEENIRIFYKKQKIFSDSQAGLKASFVVSTS